MAFGSKKLWFKLPSVRGTYDYPLCKRSLAVGITASFACFSSPVLADQLSVCVVCNDPGKVYQCTFSTIDVVNVAPNVRGFHFACIQEIAQYGEHSQCAARRNDTIACKGEPYTLKSAQDLYKPEPEGEALVEGEPETSPPVQHKKQPTLVDSTSKTYKKAIDSVEQGYESTKNTVKKGYKSTTKTVKSVGDKINDAAKTTYDCVMSLFSDCSD